MNAAQSEARALALARVQAAVKRTVVLELDRNDYRIDRNLSNLAVQAVNGGKVGMTGGIRQFAYLLDQKVGNEGDLLKAHIEVAAAMRQSVKNSYRRQVRTLSGQYRVGDDRRTTGGFLFRYSGGALYAAITSPSLAVGTPQGIKYVDEGRLTREAAHWARLNFGTAPYSRPKTAFRIIFDGRVVGSVGFNVGTRPGFSLPPGYWRTKSGKFVKAGEGVNDQFFVGNATILGELGSASVYSKEKKRFEPGRAVYKTGLSRKTTRGIKPRNFLDAGLHTLAVQLPLKYDFLHRKWLNEASSEALARAPQRFTARGGPSLKIRYRAR